MTKAESKHRDKLQQGVLVFAFVMTPSINVCQSQYKTIPGSPVALVYNGVPVLVMGQSTDAAQGSRLPHKACTDELCTCLQSTYALFIRWPHVMKRETEREE